MSADGFNKVLHSVTLGGLGVGSRNASQTPNGGFMQIYTGGAL
jgi:hypothetical protein